MKVTIGELVTIMVGLESYNNILRCVGTADTENLIKHQVKCIDKIKTEIANSGVPTLLNEPTGEGDD